MAFFHYFIFLACLALTNGVVLYSFFLWRDAKEMDRLHNEMIVSVLPEAYPVFILSFLAGTAALFFLTPDKVWFFEAKFWILAGVNVVFALLGLLPQDKKVAGVFKSLAELTGISAFVFIIPDNKLFSVEELPPEVGRAGMALIWFIVFKFQLVLNRFEGVVAAEAFHIGFSSVLLLILAVSPAVPLLQINGQLGVLVIMLTPFYYVIPYEMPLKKACANALCFSLTGLMFLMAMNGYWGVAVLMLIYVFFEMTVVCCHWLKNMIFRRQDPLFFFEMLSNKGIPDERIVGLIVRYNVVVSMMILSAVLISAQVQVLVLAVLFYARLYSNIVNANRKKTSFAALYKQTRRDLKKEWANTKNSMNKLKEKYQTKENKPDEHT